jgi:hypothetical protein
VSGGSTSPTEKKGLRCWEGGVRVRHHLMNPGPYRLLTLILVGMVRRGVITAPCQGALPRGSSTPPDGRPPRWVRSGETKDGG